MKKTLILALLFLSSCKTAEQHLEKFHKKGGQIECKSDTVTVERIVKGKDGRDSLIYKDSIVTKYETTIQTKWRIRFDNKRFKDSLNTIETKYKDSLKYALRNNRIDSKQEVKTIKAVNNCWTWWQKFKFGLACAIFGILICLVFRFVRTVTGAFKDLPINNR